MNSHNKKSGNRAEDLNYLLNTICNLNKIINQGNHFHKMMQNICDTLVNYKGYRACLIGFVESKSMRLIASSGKPIIENRECSLKISRDDLPEYIMEVIRDRQLILIEDKEDSTIFCDRYTAIDQMAVVPMQNKSGIIGLMFICFDKDKQVSQKEKNILQKIANNLAFPESILDKERALKKHEELIKNRHLLQRTQKMANLGSWEHDLQAQRLYWSDMVYNIFGCDPEEFNPSYEKFINLVHPDDRTAVDEAYKESINEKQDGYEIEHRIIKKSTGTIRYVSEKCEHMKNESGKIYRSVGLVRDITEERLREEKLIESEEKFRTLAETSPMAILLFRDEKWIYANEAAENISGYTMHELQTMEFWRIIAPKFKKRFTTRLKRKEKQRELFSSWEMKIISKDGQEKWVLLNGEFININNKSTGIITAVDITERKQLEEELLQAQKLESIGNLAAGVAHDFNNMLAVIKGRTEMALMKANPEESFHKDLEEVLAASDRAAELTQQMLLFSRKKGMQFERLDLNIIIKDLLKMLQRLIGEDIDIITKFESDLWPVKADKSNFNQVLMNIAVNARDAMPQGGEFIIKTRNKVVKDKDPDSNYNLEPGKYVEIIMKDSGEGISDNIIDKIFDPFFTTKGRAKGTGMGLAVVYGIIKKHGGNIHVSSESGQGTTFSIFIPALDGPIGTKTKKDHHIQAKDLKGNGEWILFIEDDADVSHTFERFLSFGGYNIDTAISGSEAIKLFSQDQNKYDLIISDVVLPDFNGVELTDKFRGIKPIPCLLISGYPENKSNKNKIDNKELPFIQKPFDLKDLLGKIREVLQQATN